MLMAYSTDALNVTVMLKLFCLFLIWNSYTIILFCRLMEHSTCIIINVDVVHFWKNVHNTCIQYVVWKDIFIMPQLFSFQSLDGFAFALSNDGRFLYISETVSIYLGLSQVRLLWLTYLNLLLTFVSQKTNNCISHWKEREKSRFCFVCVEA